MILKVDMTPMMLFVKRLQSIPKRIGERNSVNFPDLILRWWKSSIIIQMLQKN